MFFPISPRPPRGIICNLDFAKINLLFSCICTSSKKIKSPYHSRLYHYNTDRKYRKTKCLCIGKKKSHGSAARIIKQISPLPSFLRVCLHLFPFFCFCSHLFLFLAFYSTLPLPSASPTPSPYSGTAYIFYSFLS